jgi:hypothetical protein
MKFIFSFLFAGTIALAQVSPCSQVDGLLGAPTIQLLQSYELISNALVQHSGYTSDYTGNNEMANEAGFTNGDRSFRCYFGEEGLYKAVLSVGGKSAVAQQEFASRKAELDRSCGKGKGNVNRMSWTKKCGSKKVKIT